MPKTMMKIIKSWANKDGNIDSTEEIIKWIQQLNSKVKVSIIKDSLYKSIFWFYDEERGEIRNKDNSFFQIKGLKKVINDRVLLQQPIIIQNEIGYLGIICKEIDGVLNFLMQAKIEPGNINKIQISPTIQATKSNFTQKHGGTKPPYLQYFIEANKYEIIVDQVQSEQSSRFYKKRNRNIIIKVDDNIEILPNYKWITLGQIKELMKIDNLVNMDTRTVLSCIPLSQVNFTDTELNDIKRLFTDKSLYKSIFKPSEAFYLAQIYNEINNCKMFNEESSLLVDVFSLENWRMQDNEYICTQPYDFKVVFCDIAIEGREVKRWTQPLFEAIGIATFGLITCNDKGVKKFLVNIKPEVGCFDGVEIGPSVQLEPTYSGREENEVVKLFLKKMNQNDNIKFNTLLSEEGGRFYHEQNRNIIVEIVKEEIPRLPKRYFWVDYKTLNTLVQVNNCLNIQLRNLLSLLEV
jgi:oxidase EvaA